MTPEQHRQTAEMFGLMSLKMVIPASRNGVSQAPETWIDTATFIATVAAHHGALALWLGDGYRPTPEDD